MHAGPCVQGVLDRCRALDPGCVKSSQTAKGGDTFGFDSVRILGFGKGRGKGTKKGKQTNALVSPKGVKRPCFPPGTGRPPIASYKSY